MRYIILLWLAVALGACAAPPAPPVPTVTPLPLETLFPPDAVRALEEPSVVPAAEAAPHITAGGWVMGVEIGGEARAYPLGLLSRYEIVNDTLGGEPIAVIFCPLCNSGMALSRQVGEEAQVLTFAVSGQILDNALVMVDRQSGSLWPQSRLSAISGPWEGTALRLLPAQQMSWQAWREQHPTSTLVVDEAPIRHTTFSLPSLPTQGTPEPDQAATGYVVGVVTPQQARAYALQGIEAAGLVQEALPGAPPFMLLSLAEPGQIQAWSRELDGEPLTFQWEGEWLKDQTSGTLWNPRTGQAEEGPLAGRQLAPFPTYFMHVWGWQDWYPHSDLWTGPVAGAG